MKILVVSIFEARIHIEVWPALNVIPGFLFSMAFWSGTSAFKPSRMYTPRQYQLWLVVRTVILIKKLSVKCWSNRQNTRETLIWLCMTVANPISSNEAINSATLVLLHILASYHQWYEHEPANRLPPFLPTPPTKNVNDPQVYRPLLVNLHTP